MVDDSPSRSHGEFSFVTVDQLLDRLDAERSHVPGSILASDADGTLWDGDVGIDLFETVLNMHGVRDAAAGALIAEARSIGVSSVGSATAIAESLYAAYKANCYPADRAFAMMAWCFAGYRPKELKALADRVLDEGGLAFRIRPSMRRILDWAADRGVEVFVVSASPVAIVAAAAARLGLDAEQVVAMTPAVGDHGALLPALAGVAVYGEGKLRALSQARGGAYGEILAAFGDSPYDAAMLRAARIPVAVTPAPALLALAPTIAGLVLLGR